MSKQIHQHPLYPIRLEIICAQDLNIKRNNARTSRGVAPVSA